jgi:hypothetical protein
MASRKISDCTPALQAKIKRFTIAMFSAGLPFVITCTARTVKEQVALYSQGRETLLDTNTLREIAGLPPISVIGNNHKVTWTLKSNHIIDLDDADPGNDLSRAFDIAIARDGKPVWDVKVNVNHNEEHDYLEAGKIGESVGLRWGGRFKTPDMCHFEDV